MSDDTCNTNDSRKQYRGSHKFSFIYIVSKNRVRERDTQILFPKIFAFGSP